MGISWGEIGGDRSDKHRPTPDQDKDNVTSVLFIKTSISVPQLDSKKESDAESLLCSEFSDSNTIS